jgi:ABC-type multidrug transport system ATPase subunit
VSLVFKDPLSALDAHVGEAVFKNVLLNSSQGKTRILLTHALHFLPQVDYILSMVGGRIAERGTYAELVSKSGEFSKFVEEFGSKEDATRPATEPSEKEGTETSPKKDEKQTKTDAGPGIVQAEERAMGAVSRDAYIAYVKAGNRYMIFMIILLSLALVQGATVMSSYWSVTSTICFSFWARLGLVFPL